MTEPRFPNRLFHETPSWVQSGETFHIRLRTDPTNRVSLTTPETAARLLDATKHYHASLRWHIRIFLLMPDHAHALLSFSADVPMARTIGDWKRFTAKRTGIVWQPNFFDHRIRDASSLQEKYAYILRNPHAKSLCRENDHWPWQWKP